MLRCRFRHGGAGGRASSTRPPSRCVIRKGLLEILERLQQDRLLASRAARGRGNARRRFPGAPAGAGGRADRWQGRRAPAPICWRLSPERFLRVWSLHGENLGTVSRSCAAGPGPAPGRAHERRMPAPFGEIFDDAVLVPLGGGTPEEAQHRITQGVERYFEERWLHQPLRSSAGVPPIDAAGHGTLRKKLRGVVQFLEECAAGPAATMISTVCAASSGCSRPSRARARGGTGNCRPGPPSWRASPESLADEKLEEAYQAALRLDARRSWLAVSATLIARPARPERTDRFPVYNQLVQQALAEVTATPLWIWSTTARRPTASTTRAGAATITSCAARQIEARRGEIDAAQDVFDRLVERCRPRLKYQGSRRGDAVGQAGPARPALRRAGAGPRPPAEQPRLGAVLSGAGRCRPSPGRVTIRIPAKTAGPLSTASAAGPPRRGAAAARRTRGTLHAAA